MTAPLAAIVYSAGFAIDELMAEVADALRRAGVRLGGVVQHNSGDCASGCASMALEDLASGRRFPISEDRGAGSTGCRLDAAGLAAAGAAVSDALSGPVDLVIVNKFGKQEVLGQGLRAEIAAGVLAGLPLLTAVRDDMLAAWSDFAGEDWQRLPSEPAAVTDWATAALRLPA
ncbi:DUF2478 domain-containing protein [Bosea sp. CS1GBMeth4]|uniref:DUF2478 domain-containing protein n=1 Tax=Bosea sp. CS1GBMeth4 TaxID=1892849 RepID=UPI001648E79D|nr:DUF2478 domain-containing protein [Bosea sp. CS1GBMeth4]